MIVKFSQPRSASPFNFSPTRGNEGLWEQCLSKGSWNLTNQLPAQP